MIIKNNSRPVEDTLEMNETIGKPVYDIRSEEIGKIKEIHYDPETLQIEGIRIAKGLFKDSDYIGREYLLSLTDKAAVLSVVPTSELIGMEVVDKNDNKVGKIKDINRTRKTNSLISFVVDRGITKNDIIITDQFIDAVGDNMRLNDEVEE